MPLGGAIRKNTKHNHLTTLPKGPTYVNTGLGSAGKRGEVWAQGGGAGCSVRGVAGGDKGA